MSKLSINKYKGGIQSAIECEKVISICDFKLLDLQGVANVRGLIG